MGQGGVVTESVCRCSPWSSHGVRDSNRCSWNGKESALGRLLSSEVGKADTHAIATAKPCDFHFASRCHTSFSRLKPSQRPLDALLPFLGPGRQRWIRACEQPPCSKAFERSGHRYLCRKTHDGAGSKVCLRPRNESSCG